MTEAPKVGLKLKIFGLQEFRKTEKSLGADLPHPGCYKVQKAPG